MATVCGMYSENKITNKSKFYKEAKMTPGEVQPHYCSDLIRRLVCFMPE